MNERNHASSLWGIFSFRFSERVAVPAGAKLTKVDSINPGAKEKIFAWLAGQTSLLDLNASHDPAKTAGLTHAFMGIFQSTFSNAYSWDCAGPPVAIEQSGSTRLFRACRCFAFYSSDREADASEGEDLILLMLFEAAEAQSNTQPESGVLAEGDAGRMLDQNEGWSAFCRVTGNASIGVQFANNFRTGFRVVRWETDAGDANGKSFQEGYAIVLSFLYYCYLLCQRLERDLLRERVKPDYDQEYREFLLVLRKFSAAARRIRLRNRTYPASRLLMHYHALLKEFRLDDQLQQIDEMLRLEERDFQARNDYYSGQRLKALQVIAAVGAGVGVGVSLNTIQMWPFYVSVADNIFAQLSFWITFAAIGGISWVLWHFSISRFGRGSRKRIE